MADDFQKPIPLSPIDYIFVGKGAYPLEFALFYNGKLSEEKLIASLTETLKSFPPLSSFIEEDDHGNLVFDPKPERFVFSTQTFDDTEHNIYDFVDPVFSYIGKPTLKIRLTHQGNRSILSVSASHAAVDGFSYFYFLSSWSKIFHNQAIIPPSHHRENLIPKLADPNSFDQKKFLEAAHIFIDKEREEIERKNLTWSSMPFTKERQKQLFEESSRDKQPGDGHISFNDLVSAWLLKNKFRNSIDKSANYYLSIPVDYRRTSSLLTANYFGNGIVPSLVTISGSELAETSVASLAGKVRQAVRSASDNNFTEAMEHLWRYKLKEGTKGLDRLQIVHPSHGLLVTNLSRLPLLELDFGFGIPYRAEILTPGKNIAVILAAEDGVVVKTVS